MSTFTERKLVRAPEVCKRAQITYRQLDYWCRIGLLPPTVHATGSGSQRGYENWQIVAAAVLGKFGLSNTNGLSARDIVYHIAKTWDEHQNFVGRTIRVESSPGIATIIDLDVIDLEQRARAPEAI